MSSVEGGNLPALVEVTAMFSHGTEHWNKKKEFCEYYLVIETYNLKFSILATWIKKIYRKSWIIFYENLILLL